MGRCTVCVFDSVSATDAEISVRFKPVSGREDQGAGIVWRYRDKDNCIDGAARRLVLFRVDGSPASFPWPRGPLHSPAVSGDV